MVRDISVFVRLKCIRLIRTSMFDRVIDGHKAIHEAGDEPDRCYLSSGDIDELKDSANIPTVDSMKSRTAGAPGMVAGMSVHEAEASAVVGENDTVFLI